MKSYVKNYLKEKGLVQGDVVECSNCGKQDYIENMNLHHKKFRSQGGSDDVENLQILCFWCHYRLHNG